MIELIDFGKDYGDFTRRRTPQPQDRGRRDVRLHRPQRRRQEHDHPLSGDAAQGQPRRGDRQRPQRHADPMAVRQSVGYMPDNFGVYDGMKVWEFLDFFAVAYQIAQGQAQAGHQRRAGAAGPGAQARRLRQRPVARHEAAALPGQDAGPRSAGADPRRADQRPRSAGPHRGQGPVQRAAADGQDDPDLQPHPLRAGRLLHVDRHHRARAAADARPDRRRLSPHPRQPHGRGPVRQRHGRRPLGHPQQPPRPQRRGRCE